MVSIDEAQNLLDEVAQSLPGALFERLNGGICLLPDAKPDSRARKNDLYILGEYHAGGALGRYITMYYGSFERLYPQADAVRTKELLRGVLLHELTHHLESMAGERDLEREDQKKFAAYENDRHRR